MRHSNPTPVYVVVASWLAVGALGLAAGVLGADGLMKLKDGGDPATPVSGPVLDSTGLAGSTSGQGSPSGQGPGPVPGSTADSGLTSGGGSSGDADPDRLQAARVVPPSDRPDGIALPGRAPSAQLPRVGDFTPFVPTSVRLPSGRLAPIQPVRVHSDGSLDVPSNPDRVGWWTGGAQAGEPYGSIVLAGHVDSATYGVGVLAEMLTMHAGQVLKLGDGLNGQRYRVELVRKVPKARLAAGTDLFAQDVKHRLVMITCGGPFDQRTHRYRDNVVIVATPVA